jgi:hypothetical protein
MSATQAQMQRSLTLDQEIRRFESSPPSQFSLRNAFGASQVSYISPHILTPRRDCRSRRSASGAARRLSPCQAAAFASWKPRRHEEQGMDGLRHCRAPASVGERGYRQLRFGGVKALISGLPSPEHRGMPDYRAFPSTASAFAARTRSLMSSPTWAQSTRCSSKSWS